MEEILRGKTIGFLGMSVAGKPYVVPLNYAYVEGRILCQCFHRLAFITTSRFDRQRSLWYNPASRIA
jgi:nitroimidazol reductase NimA-like FMN-containing flavoprotein (pyridoxamine 5'-phosphate oxidase superfamily)